MPPPEGSGRARRPRKPAPRRDPIRDAASEAGAISGHPGSRAETNGNGAADWVDYDAPAESWDPWEETEAGHEARGLNRTMGEWLQAVVPPEAQVHFFNAGKEFAAGVQTTIDYHLHRGAGGDLEDGADQALRIEIE